MKKILYSIFLFCSLIIFSGCLQAGNNELGSIDNPIILLTCSENAGDKELWVKQVDKAFGEDDYIVKPSYLVNYQAAAELLWNEEHKGNIILSLFESALYLPANGESGSSIDDWEFYIAGRYPELLFVSTESGISSVNELIYRIKNDDLMMGATKGNSTTAAKLFLSLIGETNRNLTLVPGNSKGDTLVLIDYGVDAIITNAKYMSTVVKYGTWIPIGVISDENYENERFGEVPSITEAIPEFSDYMPMDRLFGIMIPADTPEEQKIFIRDEFLKQNNSGLYNEFFEDFYIIPYLATGNEAQEFLREMQQNMCKAADAIGEAENCPED